MQRVIHKVLLATTILAGASLPAFAQRVPPAQALSVAQTFYSRTGSGFDNGLAAQKIASANTLGLPVFEVFVPGSQADTADMVSTDTHALAANISAKFPGRPFIALVCDYYTNGTGTKVVHNCDGETSSDLARYLSKQDVAGALRTNAATLASGDYEGFAGGFVSAVENTLRVKGYGSTPAVAANPPVPVPHQQVITTTTTTRVVHHTNGFLVFIEWAFGLIALFVVGGFLVSLFRRPAPQVVVVDRGPNVATGPAPAPAPASSGPRPVPPGLAAAQTQFNRFSTPGAMASSYNGRPYGAGVSIIGTPYYDQYSLYYGNAMGYYYAGDMIAYQREMTLLDGVLLGAAAYCAYEIGREAFLIDPVYARSTYGYYDGLGFDEYQTTVVTNTTVINNFYEPGSVVDVASQDVPVSEWQGGAAISDEAAVDMTAPADNGWNGGAARTDEAAVDMTAPVDNGWNGGAATAAPAAPAAPVDNGWNGGAAPAAPVDNGWGGGAAPAAPVDNGWGGGADPATPVDNGWGGGGGGNDTPVTFDPNN